MFKSINSFKKVLILVILASIFVACSNSNDQVYEETKGWTVQKLYTQANNSLNKQSYTRAIKLYLALESTYPYGVYAQQGLLDLAYAYYENDQPELALPTLDQFMNTYPTNENMDYALYLKGFINYNNDKGLMSRITGQDLSERDSNSLQEAYKSFNELVTTYPNSGFTPDAKERINRLINAMARSEIYKARYYVSIHAYLAAIGRAQLVIKNYPNTKFVEESLAIQIFAYDKLGQPDLSKSVQKVLVINFPKSKYIRHEWENNDIAWYAFWR